LFNILSSNNRIDLILSVCSAFVKLYYDYKNIVEVTVTTPIEISDEVESTIKKYISSIKTGEIKLTKKKDESLIAGFTLDIDNTRLDASIKKRLNMMKKQLKTN
jgi:F0F1-type ATP synthase delta subunit